MTDIKKFRPDPDLKLMEQVRQVLRYHHYAYKTEQTYCGWIIDLIRFYEKKIHPRDMGKQEIEKYLSHLATHRNVSASTQRQALNAIVFLYRHVLDMPVDEHLEPIRAKKKNWVPTVMTQQEVQVVLSHISGIHLLMSKILYGSGLRLMECVRLRIKDIDFSRQYIYVYDGKGGKDRVTVFPKSITTELMCHVEQVRQIHEKDLADGHGEVYMPHALERKFKHAGKEFRWQYLFPAKNLSKDPRSDVIRRHHVNESGLQKAVKTAVSRAGIAKRVTCHTFRHCFGTHMLENGVNIRELQVMMGHQDVKTTEIYTHVMERNIKSIQSPLDRLFTTNPLSPE
jgi:integron integrase